MAGPWDQYAQQPSDQTPVGPWSQYQGENPTQAPKPAGVARRLADLGLGFAGGAVGATKAITDAAGAGNAASNFLDSANKDIEGALSPQAQADKLEQSRIMKDAEGKGLYEGVKAGVKAFGVAPMQTMSSGMGSIVPTVAIGALTGGSGAVASRLAAASTGLAMGAGTVKGTIYDDIKRRSLAAGQTPEQAEASAQQAQAYGGGNTDQILLGAGLGAADSLTGVTGAANKLVNRALGREAAEQIVKGSSRGILARAGMGALGEMPLEAAQGGQEQLASNIAAQRAGYQAGTWDNVASNATLEALASAGPGAGFGMANTHRPAAQKPEVTPDQTTPPADAGKPGVFDNTNAPAPYINRGVMDAAGLGDGPPAPILDTQRLDAMLGTPEPKSTTPVVSAIVAPPKVSEALGIDPANGAISRMAALAVDTAPMQPNILPTLDPLSGSVQTGPVDATVPPGDDLRQGITNNVRTNNTAGSNSRGTDIAVGDNTPRSAIAGSGLALDAPVAGSSREPGPDARAGQTATTSDVGRGNGPAPLSAPAPNLREAIARNQLKTQENAANVPQLAQAGTQTSQAPSAQGATQGPASTEQPATPPATLAGTSVNANGTETNQAKQAEAQRPQAPAPAVERPANWRKNVFAAAKVARTIGLEPKGMKLSDIVSAVDARDTVTSVQPGESTNVQASPAPTAATQQAPQAARVERGADAPVTNGQAIPSAGVPAAGGSSVQAAGVGNDARLTPVSQRGASNQGNHTNEQISEWEDRDTAPVGAWVKADFKTDTGQPVYRVASLPVDKLYLPELTDEGKLQPEKRKYLEPYTQMAKDGKNPPSITVVEMEDGRLRVVDGTRRVMAARAAGKKSIRAIVSPLLDGKDATLEMVQRSESKPSPEASPLGRNNIPLSDGGTPFKTRREAAIAKKQQPMMRVIQSGKGYVLTPKTEKQLAAEAKAARRIAQARTSPAGEPIPAHAFIASEGGMRVDSRRDMGVDGNPRIGNRTLFAKLGSGLTIEQATQKLIQDQYLPEGASHSEAYALIRKSLANPQYNADGIERIAQAEMDTRFNDYLEAEQEGAFDDLSNDFTADELSEAGYDSASDAIKAEVNALLEMADAKGIDTEAIREDAAKFTDTEQAYYEAAKSALENSLEAIERGNQDRGQTAGSESQASGSEDFLTGQTPAELAQKQQREDAATKAEAQRQQDAERRAQADSERDTFALTGSDRAADVGAAAGQKDIFSSPPAQDTAPDLESIFDRLDRRGRMKSAAEADAKAHPRAEQIATVQKDFHDILIALMDNGKLEVNGQTSLTEDNKSCM